MSFWKSSTREQTSLRDTSTRTMLVTTAALLLALSPRLTRAEPFPALEAFAGNFAYAGTREHGVALVNAAVDEGMAERNAVVRFLIKKNLAAHFADVIVIKTPPGKIGIKTGDLPEAILDIGKSETFKNDQGKSLKVTRLFDNGRLIETSVSELGTTVTVYELSADGKLLHRNVAFRNESMSKPMTYSLDYKRR